jgi:hypothetical protein
MQVRTVLLLLLGIVLIDLFMKTNFPRTALSETFFSAIHAEARHVTQPHRGPILTESFAGLFPNLGTSSESLRPPRMNTLIESFYFHPSLVALRGGGGGIPPSVAPPVPRSSERQPALRRQPGRI